MVIDTSAIIAIILREPEGWQFRQLIGAASTREMSAARFAEAGIVMLGKRGVSGIDALRALVRSLGIVIVPLNDTHAELAVTAYERFGKGRHPAGLNYGDCFSYALAQTRGEPLLAKGNDFARTDAVMAG